MKQQLLVIFILLLYLRSTSQTYYKGLERMCWKNSKGEIECYDSPRKWYHLNTILIEGDSVFLYKVPLSIDKKDTIYSASDGGFYYYYGALKQVDSSQLVYLTSHNCDYCGTTVRKDSATGFYFPIPRMDTLEFVKSYNSLRIGETSYKTLTPTKDFYFPAKTYFYYDSNSISRREPLGQYHLISKAIKNFLQTKQLKLDNDTLRVCLDRYEYLEQNKLIELLSADSFHIDTSNIHIVFLTRNTLRSKSNIEKKVIRYIEINQIIDFWKAARIELTYKIQIPQSVHKFSEREYNNLFEYSKVGQTYELVGKPAANSWSIVEQK